MERKISVFFLKIANLCSSCYSSFRIPFFLSLSLSSERRPDWKIGVISKTNSFLISPRIQFVFLIIVAMFKNDSEDLLWFLVYIFKLALLMCIHLYALIPGQLFFLPVNKLLLCVCMMLALFSTYFISISKPLGHAIKTDNSLVLLLQNIIEKWIKNDVVYAIECWYYQLYNVEVFSNSTWKSNFSLILWSRDSIFRYNFHFKSSCRNVAADIKGNYRHVFI